ALAEISETALQLQGIMMKMENFQKLLELKKDLTGIENLVMPGRVRVYQVGLPQQTVGEGPAAEDVLPGMNQSFTSGLQTDPTLCAAEMERWVEDIRMAIDLAEQNSNPNTDLLSTSPPENSKMFPTDYYRYSHMHDVLTESGDVFRHLSPHGVLYQAVLFFILSIYRWQVF
ncbi:hypothetical protein GOODEAATRI_004892, partial [Goodea atripinnis]